MYEDLCIKGKKVLLLGGAGFIGHNLGLALAEKGALVTIADGFSVNSLVNLSINSSETMDVGIYKDFLSERVELLKLAAVELMVSNATNRYQTAQLLNKDFDVVYLLAAVSHASRSNTDPCGAINNGLYPFLNVVTELANRKDTRVVYLSSSTVYGHFEKDTVDESDECKPYGMYAVLKHIGERILSETASYSSLNYSVVRPSALYGERCISRRVSQIFLENAFAGRELIFKGDSDEKLDFTYIQDLIEGLLLAGFHPKAKGEIFNITFGKARPVLKLVDILKDYFPDISLKILEREQATPKRGTLSNKKARELLGFNPKWELERGYRKYIEWYIKRGNERQYEFKLQSQINE